MTTIICLKLFLFSQHPYLDKRYRYRQQRGITQDHLMTCKQSYIYIYIYIHIYIHIYIIYISKTTCNKIDPCWIPQFISPVSEKTSIVAEKFLFERYDWNRLMTDSLKPIHFIFCKSAVWSNESNVFYRSTRIIPVWNHLSISLKIKSVSCTRQESVEKCMQKLAWYL